jgi:hypothetical protein
MCYDGFVEIVCCQCNIMFAIPETLHDRLHRCHNPFYCPVGHAQHFAQVTEEERLKARVKVLERELGETEQRAKSAERSARSLKGVLTRTRNKREGGNG